MITKDNFKDVLKVLNFEENNNIFTKHFPEMDAYLKADLNKNELIYPIEKGFTVNADFTANFTSNENFVVFECVCRLLNKGYKPQHIELEQTYNKIKKDDGGGRADVIVKDNNNDVLIIIECKTAGSEFRKHWDKTLMDGDQLFRYLVNKRETNYLCLYSSDFTDNAVTPDYQLITLIDNQKLLDELKDKKPISFAEAKKRNKEDIYKAWKETYSLDSATRGIFEDDIQAYHIGKLNYSIKDLSEISSKDIQRKYHEFATIMRQHNVSGRENAFDKLVNLFLCKLVDEKSNTNNLKFYWKGIAYDTFFDLQDRLELLYQAGMKEFLKEDVTYINSDKIKKAFKYVVNDPDATQETVLKYFFEQKFFTNNDFAFIDVHNEKLFYQNAEVLLKVLKMLQDIRLQSENSNQFLGDMFEGFLDQGVKQSEGQFFTPMPIVKFVINSLPLENIINASELPPKAIDYACGAGHFLNELALQIKPFVPQTANVKDYYKNIVGIEKEYRLSKVAKVSAFMYGQDEIDIAYADALTKHEKLQENDYSILVANPPFSVKGFLQTLSETERKSFTLMDAVDEKSLANNNSIETFFIERAKQLLKPGAVAGIILPSSVLSNDSNIYINTREIILKYFDIVSIVEFGSQTFGKTGTNTVTLFLRRKEENPSAADHWQNRVNAWFADNQAHKSADVVYDDAHLIQSYTQHINVELDDYKTLLQGKPNENLLETEMFLDYRKEFDKKKQAFSNKLSLDEKKAEIEKRFTEYLQTVEKDKLYFYVLAVEQKNKVLVVKCPTDNKEQKQFLGYEWSSAKGNEGIKYLNQSSPLTPRGGILDGEVLDADSKELITKLMGLGNINTPLYNPQNRNDATKINQFIQQNFLGNELDITENVSSHINYYRLVDMLDFSRKEFNKQFLLKPQSITTIESKWNLVKLGDVVVPMGGLWTGKKEPFKTVNVIRNTNFKKGGKLDFSDIAQIEVEVKQFENRKLEKGDIIIEKSGGSETQAVGRVVLFLLEDGDYSFSNFTARFRPDKEKINSIFLHLYLNYFYDLGFTFDFQNGASGLKNLDLNRYLEVKIPLPPLDIQHKIVAECEGIDLEVSEAEEAIEQSRNEIEVKIQNEFSKSYAMDKIANLSLINPSKTEIRNTDDNTMVSFVEMASVSEEGFISKTVGKPLKDLRKGSYTYFRENDIIIAKITPCMENGKCAIAVGLTNEIGMGSSEFHVIRVNEKINHKYLFAFLNRDVVRKEAERNMTGSSGHRRVPASFYENFKIPVPPITEQEQLVAQIEQLEGIIKENQVKIAGSSERKKAVMKKYL
jgi:type I restriction enzyme M protein